MFDTGWPYQVNAQTCQSNVTTVSKSGCFSEKKSLEDSVILVEDCEDGSDVVSGVKNNSAVKVAPIFLRKTPHSRRKGTKAPLGHNLKKQTFPQKPATILHRHDSPVINLSSPRNLNQIEGGRPTRSHGRGELSSSALKSCLEEIRASNPNFPIRRVFSVLQNKCSISLQGLTHPEETCDPNTSSLQQESTGGKRKCYNGRDNSDQTLKRQRSCSAADKAVETSHNPISRQSLQGYTDISTSELPRRGRLSRSHRLKQLKGSGGQFNSIELECMPATHTTPESLPLTASDSLQRDYNIEDRLWTEKYSPRNSAEVIGNSTSVKKLHSWMKEWKLRADCNDRRKARKSMVEENSSDSWDCGDFQGEAGSEVEGGEELRNTMVITGPAGVGKTASVYACAQELGFKVFEVNCSSQRNGRHVLTQLKEATQSHLVETKGNDLLKPAYLNNYNTSSSSVKPDSVAGKTTPKTVVSISKEGPKKKNQRPLGCKRKPSPPSVTLTNFFKLKANADSIHYGEQPSEMLNNEVSLNPLLDSDNTSASEQSRRMVMSLILFEEVDVIFDDDVGFLTAIKTLMETTKRPVILTTNDPTFRERFDSSLEEIIFKIPSLLNVCSYLRLLCLAENVRTDQGDVLSLLRLCQGDIRRSLLQLQFWAQSGGQQTAQTEALHKDSTGCNDIEGEDGLMSRYPASNEGCTANMLGLHQVRRNLLSSLKCQSWTEPDNRLMKTLTESWRMGVSLLYSNLELLLPPPESTSRTVDLNPAPPEVQPQVLLTDQAVDITATTKANPVRAVSRLSRRKRVAAVSVSKSVPSVGLKSRVTSFPPKKTHLRALSLKDEPKTMKNAATHCLDTFANFADLMSCLDATMSAREPHITGSCRPEEFVWTGAEVKDGMLDEMTECNDEIYGQEMLLEIKAAAEILGFQSCWRVSEVWNKDQRGKQDLWSKQWVELMEKFNLPVLACRKRFSFHLPSLCESSVAHRRFDLSRTVLSSRSFRLLGNRQAVHVDYMPVLRAICRSGKTQQLQEIPGRYLNHISKINLGLSKSAVQLLAEDFP